MSAKPLGRGMSYLALALFFASSPQILESPGPVYRTPASAPPATYCSFTRSCTGSTTPEPTHFHHHISFLSSASLAGRDQQSTQNRHLTARLPPGGRKAATTPSSERPIIPGYRMRLPDLLSARRIVGNALAARERLVWGGMCAPGQRDLLKSPTRMDDACGPCARCIILDRDQH